MKYNKIIVAVSLEPETHRALAKLRELNLDINCEIHLVHVVPVILYSRGLHLSVLTYPLEEDRPKFQEGVLSKLTDIKKEILPRHNKVFYKCIFDSNEKAAFNDYV